MAKSKGFKRKRKVRLRIRQSANLVHKNDKTRVARKDGLFVKTAPTRPPADVAPTFRIKIKRKK